MIPNIRKNMEGERDLSGTLGENVFAFSLKTVLKM